MRALILPLLLLLSSCGQGGEPASDAAPGATGAAMAGQWQSGRDLLCLKGERAGLIVYAAEGDSNCMVRGVASSEGSAIRIKPDGDASCTIDARMDGGAVVLGDVTPACAYYCGPKSSFAGKRLEPDKGSQPAADLAGDPLC